MLLSMIVATTDSNNLRVATYLNGGVYNSGIINMENQKLFDSWIDQHVKDEDQNSIRDFLTNPSKHPLPKALHSMIKWDG